MTRTVLTLLAGLAVLPLAPRSAAAQQPDVTAKRIRVAIDDAVLHMRTLHREDGVISDNNTTYLAALALLAAGADPVSDKQLQKTLDWLAGQEPDNTYLRGIRANVWEYALRRTPENKKYRQLLKNDFDWLIKALGNKEGWRYTLSGGGWDNSCTQYGVLGVWAAQRAGFEPGDKFWNTLSKHFRESQSRDGGWTYTGKGDATGNHNMTTAGLASVFLVYDSHHAKTVFDRANPPDLEKGDLGEVLKSMDRGVEWFSKNGGAQGGYFYYGIERTGVASGRKYFGDYDWFADGSARIVAAQRGDGSIPLCRWGQQYGTPLCTLFLVYGGAPVAFNKLQYGDGYDWNLNPRDLANLSKDLWSAYESPVNWQTVSIDAPATEFEAPILFVSGSKAAEFTEEQMLKLREYVLRGGTILAEPSDHSPEFAKSMERLLENMFDPRDHPHATLKPLGEDHPVFTVLDQNWKRRPKLRGASDGTRTFFIISDEYLSADWQRNEVDSDSFRLATNLLFYVTDLGTLRPKFDSILPETPPAEANERPVRIARIWHGGSEGPHDWDAGAMTWKAFAPYLKHVTGSELQESGPAFLDGTLMRGVSGNDVIHLTGRDELILTPAERTGLKQFVENGGTVLVDAFAGSETFAKSAEKVLTEVFGKLEPLADDHPLAEGRFAGGQDLGKTVRFKLTARKRLRANGEPTSGQKLLVAAVDGRPAVLFSKYDLSAALAGQRPYGAVGYQADSARRIVSNVLAYATLE